MEDQMPRSPPAPELPKSVLDAIERQPPDRLADIAEYAEALAEWKEEVAEMELAARRKEESVDQDELDELASRDVSTEPQDYDEVPNSGAYITVKETKPGYFYYYWQWRSGETWKNKYIAPVNPK